MEREQTLLKSIAIETIIPEDGASELPKLLDDVSSSEERPANGIIDVRKRDLLFVDEKVRALALLQISQCEEDELRSLISRTEFRVEVWAFDGSSNAEHATAFVEPSKDLVYSTLVPKTEDPIVLAQTGDEEGDGPSLILAWELSLVFHRPRVRMQDPLVYVHSIAMIPALSSRDEKHEACLVPFKPFEPNVLEPMRNMPGLGKSVPYLAASRLERVRPVTPKDDRHFRADHMSHGYRIAPAVVTRMRYTRMSTPLPTVIASLDIEVSPVIALLGSIERSELILARGKVEDLMPKALPIACRSRDVVTLLFRLYPSRNAAAIASPVTPGAASNVDVMSVSLMIKIKIADTCQPHVQMAWTTNVDFFQALNPTFGTPSQPIQRNNRPLSLALDNGNGRASQSLSTSLQPVLQPAATSGATISFTAPDAPVEVGKPFTWNMLIMNGSAKSIKLAIIPLPRIPRGTSQSAQFAKRHAPKSSTASFQPGERRHAWAGEEDVDFAQAVVDENVVYAMQHSNAAPAGTDMMALTAEVRIGPLGPGQCHESLIEMVAFTAGTLKVDAIRVIDLMREAEEGVATTGAMLDIRDLPDVVVVLSGDST